jgi:MFS family permease
MKKFKWLLVSQSILLFGSGIVFPFYVIFIKEVGASFTQFGIAYALFSLSAAFTHIYAGKLSDKIGRKILLLINSWGTAIIFLIFPIATTIYEVYFLQIFLGFFGALYKTGEKAMVADFSTKNKRGEEIGHYHALISISSAIAVVVGGYLIDLFTLPIIFYVGSFFLFISGVHVLKINEKDI